MEMGVSVIPHPDKLEKGGEDTVYIGQNVMAVMDGVGGWIKKKIDPKKYS